MRRVWIPALAVSIVVAAGLIAIAYGQRGATPALAADPAGSPAEARAARSAEPSANPPAADAFGGGWDAGPTAPRDSFSRADAAEPTAAAADRGAPAAAETYDDSPTPATSETAYGEDDAIYGQPQQDSQQASPQAAPAPTRPKKLRQQLRPAAAEVEESPPDEDAADAEAPEGETDPYADPASADRGYAQTPDGAPADAFEAGGYRAPAAPTELTDRAVADVHRPLAAAEPAGPSFDEGAGEPGARELEGLQAASVSLEKIAPAEVQVGKETKFVVRLRNNGVIPVHNLELRDEVPKGARLINTAPAASRGPQGELLWQFETLEPGAEKSLEISLLPLVEGELGSVATVVFEGRASGRTKATQPALAIEIEGPKEVMIGEQIMLTMKISNTGSGAATGVVLEETIPEQFTHPAGKELELEVGTLGPGETRTVELTLVAARAGHVSNPATLRADGDLKVVHEIDLEVLAPDLKVGLHGPKKRFLETRATYTVSVSNPGTATAKNVELVTYLPKGLKFVQANNSGQYDAVKHAVQWNLVELPASETGDVTLVAEPIEQGEHKLRVEGRAQQGLSDQVEETVTVEGLAAILFQVVDLEDPIEVGGETTYEIRVTNQGSKAATQVQLVAHLAPEMTLVNASGPARHAAKGQRVEFEPLKALAPKAETTYKVRVRADAAGDLRLGVQILTAEIRTPITKEESTRAYSAE